MGGRGWMLRVRGWGGSIAGAAGRAGVIGAIVGAVAGGLPQTASALDAGLALSQLRHTAWTVEDGAPPLVLALAQTPDNLLWLGTPSGLYSFDGVRFRRQQSFGGVVPRSTNISSLIAARDGGLWMGFRYGGVAYWKGDRCQVFGEKDGFSLSTVNAIAEAPDGTVLAATGNGLMAYRDGRWQVLPPEAGLPRSQVDRLMFDRAGALWLTMDAGLFRRRAGATAFERVATDRRAAHLAQGPDGSLWSTGMRQPMVKLSQTTPEALPDVPPSRLFAEGGAGPMLFDRDGVLWFAMFDGIRRVTHPDRLRFDQSDIPEGEAERLTKESGLSGSTPWSLLNDREGNVWVGTSNGLDRFRAGKLTTLAMPPRAVSFSLFADMQGGMMATDTDEPVKRLSTDGTSNDERLPRHASATLREADGTLWLGSKDGLFRVPPGGTAAPVALPPQILEAQEKRKLFLHFQAIVRDARGALLISVARLGLFRLSEQGWSPWSGVEGRRKGAALALHRDVRGNLWATYADGNFEITGPDGRLATAVAPKEPTGIALAFSDARAGGLWVAGENGLFHVQDGHARAVVGEDGETLRGVSGVVETATGEVWTNGGDGVSRFSAAELKAALARPGPVVRAARERLDWRDGLVGLAPTSYPLPSLALDGAGKLWIATNSSLAWIDTAHLKRNAVPARAQVLSVQPAEGASVDVGATPADPATGGARRIALPRATRGIEIAYTAASLGMPDRVRFQYRLEGVDRDWQPAGNRRQAFYTSLSPGHYRFHLKAANEDGVWGPEAEALSVEIPPQWYQTLGFKAALAVLVLAVLSAVYLLRVRYLQGRLIEKLRVRTAERVRIARELHDTLLQETQSLVLGVQNVAAKFPAGDPSRTHLERMLDQADHVLVQARDSVQGLREHEDFPEGLIDALAAAGASLAAGTSTAFQVEGRHLEVEIDVQLGEAAQWNVFFATREALTNAFRHAGAGLVTLRFATDAQGLCVEVADDGRGIAADVLQRGARPGHWGLTGMRERMSAAGGQLSLHSDASGTVVRLALPMSPSRRRSGIHGLRARIAAFLTLSGKSAAAR